MNEFMSLAIEEAKKAQEENEIPIGAVIVKNKEVIAKAHNTVEKNKNVLYHAEMSAINEATKKLGKFLYDCELYVTVEPCPMCMGAIIASRIKRLYIGANEPNTGSCGSKLDLTNPNYFNSKIEIYHGIMESDCEKLMNEFFKNLRK